MTFTVLKTHVFYRMCPCWICLKFFSHDQSGFRVSGRKNAEINCHFHYSIPRLHSINRFLTTDTDIDHLMEVGFVRFLHHCYSYLPPFCSVLCERKQPMWEVMLTVFQDQDLHDLSVTILHGRFVSFSYLLIYSIICSIHVISTDSWIFILSSTLQSSTTSIILLLKFVQIWSLGVQLASILICLHQRVCVYVCVHLSTVLHSDTVRYPKLSLCISFLV